MKVICDRGALLEGINLVSSAVAGRSPRPQLQCVKVAALKSAGAGELVLSGTDAEIALRLSLSKVDVLKAGECLVPAEKLRAIVSAEANDPTLTLETEGDTLHIRGADAHFRLLGYPPGEFPPVPDFGAVMSGAAGAPRATATLTHPAGSLRTLVERTIFATARENSRYALNGVLFKRDGKRLELVATDGRRLALARAALAGDKDARPFQCIVPVKALSVLLKLVHDHDEPVQMALTDNQILFAFGTAASPGRAVLISNLTEGSFPPYESVIPRDNTKKIVLDRDKIASAVHRAAILTNEESRGVRLAFRGQDRRLELSGRAPEQGDATITADVASYEGEDIDISFNPAYITDALKVVEEPQVIMELKTPSSAALLKSGTDFLYILMPVTM
jgi:DNA polymerase-3 subunit beta